MSSKSVNEVPSTSIGRTIAQGVLFGSAGSFALALAGFVEALNVFPVFMAIHDAEFPTSSGGSMLGLSSGLPTVLGAAGCLFGGIAFAILGIAGSRQGDRGRSLGRLLGAAFARTLLGVATGTLGGLAIGWGLAPTPQALFMGCFYGSLLGFVAGLAITTVASIRRTEDGARIRATLVRRGILAALVVGYISACLGVLVLKHRDDNGGAARTKATLTRAGQVAPVFQVVTTDGETFDSGSRRSGPTLVVFSATWCGPCLLEMARLEPEVWQKYRDRGLTVIAIGVGEPNALLRGFRAKEALSFPFAGDPERQVFARFAAHSIPRSDPIGADGRIVHQSVGYTKALFTELVEAIEHELPRL